MNIWNEPYPSNLNSLILKCETQGTALNEKLDDVRCKTLGELYSGTTKIIRNKEAFEQLGYRPNVKEKNELKGLYVFGDVTRGVKVIPVYVGISRSIYRRLRQHGWGKLHNQATLAHAMASLKHGHKGERKALQFDKIEERQMIIRKYRVAILPEEYDYDLYFMEVYLSAKWKTLWNTFRTH